jgi:helicase associated protein
MQRLNAIGFLWNVLEANWEEEFSARAAYKARHGHCDVPTGHVEGEYKLRQWINELRNNRSSLTPERKNRLDAIGFVWSVREMEWEQGFAALKAFKSREGHCNVPQRHQSGAVKLGQWVSRQRWIKDTISSGRRKRLDEIGFIWNTLDGSWEESFAALWIFRNRVGHCRVPQLHIEGNVSLGVWVATQRRTQDAMPIERKQRLDVIGFVWHAKK